MSSPVLQLPIAGTSSFFPVQYRDAVGCFTDWGQGKADGKYGPLVIGTIIGSFLLGIVIVSFIHAYESIANNRHRYVLRTPLNDPLTADMGVLHYTAERLAFDEVCGE